MFVVLSRHSNGRLCNPLLSLNSFAGKRKTCFSLAAYLLGLNALTLTFPRGNNSALCRACVLWPRFLSLYLHFMLCGSLLSRNELAKITAGHLSIFAKTIAAVLSAACAFGQWRAQVENMHKRWRNIHSEEVSEADRRWLHVKCSSVSAQRSNDVDLHLPDRAIFKTIVLRRHHKACVILSFYKTIAHKCIFEMSSETTNSQ